MKRNRWWNHSRYQEPLGDGDSSTSTGGGGNQDSTDGVIGTGNDARLKLYDQIADQNERLHADELADVNDDDTTSTFVPPPGEDERDPVEVAAEVEAAAVEQARLDAVEAERVAAADKPVARQKIKVNGVEIELTDDLIAKAQKVASADQYLAEAAEARRTATTKPAPVEREQPSEQDVAAAALEKDRAFARAIQTGTEEEAIAAIREIRGPRSAPSVTADDISRITDERLEFKTALSWFQDQYKDLVEDPELDAIVKSRDEQLVAAGDKRPYKVRFEAVGNEVRKWVADMVVKHGGTPKPKDPVQDLSKKGDKKAEASTRAAPVVASSTAKPAVEPEDQEESAGAVIAAMAKARGGSQQFR